MLVKGFLQRLLRDDRENLIGYPTSWHDKDGDRDGSLVPDEIPGRRRTCLRPATAAKVSSAFQIGISYRPRVFCWLWVLGSVVGPRRVEQNSSVSRGGSTPLRDDYLCVISASNTRQSLVVDVYLDVRLPWASNFVLFDIGAIARRVCGRLGRPFDWDDIHTGHDQWCTAGRYCSDFVSLRRTYHHGFGGSDVL